MSFKEVRVGLEDLLKRRFFYTQSFEIYGGVAGFFDWGPPGVHLKTNWTQLWRKHFVLEEGMLEIAATNLMPYPVLKASGHVDRFNDLMVRDVEKPEICLRADHLLEEHLSKLLEKGGLSEEETKRVTIAKNRVDDMSADELAKALIDFGVKSPNGNALTTPFPFNLMFGTQIGPTGTFQGFLRPETAQGIFLNFRRLLEANNGRMPFAAAQIGNAFRNEIAPRSGLLRVREFEQAEIEHFVHPARKAHPKFSSVANLVVTFFGRDPQLSAQPPLNLTVGEAVAQGLVNNETLAYYIARTQEFLLRCGIKRKHLRFRQHLANEMAHYAADCWDAEIETSYGWVECVGCADRSAYDLTAHGTATNTELVAFDKYDQPQERQQIFVIPNKGLMGKTFGKDMAIIEKILEALSEEEKKTLSETLESQGQTTLTGKPPNCDKTYNVTKDMLKFQTRTVKVNGESYVPSVIEPSFGVGRIIYSVLEHAYYIREGEKDATKGEVTRGVLGLVPWLAPIKCCVLPLLSNRKELVEKSEEVATQLNRAGIATKTETSNSIGRRYTRFDEVGCPFGVTIDPRTLEDGTVTLRERDTMEQVRTPLVDVLPLLRDLVEGVTEWASVSSKYPKQQKEASEDA